MSEIQSAQACFADYAEQAGALTEVATFCHVQPQAVLSWQNGRWPRGESLYLLWAFLGFRGYRLAELEQLPKPSHQLLLIVASGLLSFKDVKEELKYQNLQGVYRLFSHASGLTKERAWKLEELVRQYTPVLQAYQKKMSSSLEAPVLMEQADTVIEAVETSPASVEQSSLARLLRLVVKRSGEISPDELKRQLRDVPREELEAFALLLLELV
jgi:hypothetical protein